MDKLQWFKFSYADWRMGKIQRCPEITQARFINLCCLYWSKEADLSIEDAEIEIDKEHLDILISKKIVLIENEHILIKFLDEQLDDITENSKGKSKAAKARWDKYRENKNAGAMQVHKDAMQNNAEKRREEEIREDKIRVDEEEDNRHRQIKELCIDYKKNERVINAVLKNGQQLAFSKEDLISKLDDFVLHLESIDDTVKQDKDFKSHFLNWLRIQKKKSSEKKEKPTPAEKVFGEYYEEANTIAKQLNNLTFLKEQENKKIGL
jgi:hypothetical protein